MVISNASVAPIDPTTRVCPNSLAACCAARVGNSGVLKMTVLAPERKDMSKNGEPKKCKPILTDCGDLKW